MNIVLVIPTGIGAEIGGHAGDGNPVAKLFASICDNLITHPNVVNASDINEMTENTLYVEGSMLDRFLEGEFCLKKVKYNKILLVTNSPLKNEVVNSVSAARATIGADIEIEVLKTPLRMIGEISNGIATGKVFGWKELVKQVKFKEFDALAITSHIEIEEKTKLYYFREGGVNPWGKVEAIASKLIANELNKPVAHSPVSDPKFDNSFNEIVDPRIAAEIVSISYLHCILKGLHKAPQQSNKGLSVDDVDFLISPNGCVGQCHEACLKRKIPVIVVEENETCLSQYREEFLYVDNYLEAAGLVLSAKAGINPLSVRRPLEKTLIK